MNYTGMSPQQVKAAVENAVKNYVEVGKEKGYVRSTNDLAKNIYGAAKNMAPTAVQHIADKAEGAIPSKVTDLNDKLIAGIDGRLAALTVRMNQIYHLTPADYTGYVAVRVGEMKSWTVELLHFDVLSYSKNLLSQTGDKVPTVIQANLAAAVVEVTKAGQALEAVVQKGASASKEQVDALQADLKAKIGVALTTAEKLSKTGVAFVENSTEKLPAPAQKSVEMILASPAKIKEMTEAVSAKADLDTSKKTLENITNLLAATKEVMYANMVQLSK